MNRGELISPGSFVRVLICDDHASLREALREVIQLRRSLRVVGEAVNGVEAVALAELLQPDVIMLDLMMPGLSGVDALPELRRVAPRAQIVLFSGSSNAPAPGALGAVVYLQKGASIEAIHDAIEHAARGVGEPAQLRQAHIQDAAARQAL